MKQDSSPTPGESPVAIPVTAAQQVRLDEAWDLCTYRNPRKISDPHLVQWWYWAVYEVTGIDVRDMPAFTFVVTPI